MEFNEKLQELRKARSLTQEELAEAVFVSRTAISKWESGRGYPSIDSFKELSRFFRVSIDEIIGPDEIVIAAEEDKRSFARRNTALVCGLLDVLVALLLFIPAFGNGAEAPSAVSLLTLSGVSPWVEAAFAVVVGFCTSAFCAAGASAPAASAMAAVVIANVFFMIEPSFLNCFSILYLFKSAFVKA